MPGNWNSGRRPQPTAVRLLRGNPGKRRINEAEPQPPLADAAFDEPPPELAEDATAEAEWRRLAPMLRTSGILSIAERSGLIALCQQWSRYQDAQERIRTMGVIVKKPNGTPIVNPYLTLADAALSHCEKLWDKLGLTPSARSKLLALATIEPPERASKWKGLI